MTQVNYNYCTKNTTTVVWNLTPPPANLALIPQQHASCVTRKTRSLGALVLCSICIIPERDKKKSVTAGPYEDPDRLVVVKKQGCQNRAVIGTRVGDRGDATLPPR